MRDARELKRKEKKTVEGQSRDLEINKAEFGRFATTTVGSLAKIRERFVTGQGGDLKRKARKNKQARRATEKVTEIVA